MNIDLGFYGELLGDLKTRIRQAQLKASLAINSEMISLYWDVGQMIHKRQQQDGWGAGVIPQLSRDIRNELPEVKGFSERNIGYMIRFAREYDMSAILQQPVAKLEESTESAMVASQSPCPQIVQDILAQIPWGHNILLIEKFKDLSIRLWYAQQVIINGWSRDTFASALKNHSHQRQGNAVTNFAKRLPSPRFSDLGNHRGMATTKNETACFTITFRMRSAANFSGTLYFLLTART
jgi:predicted nuclease of restriction endonuclease-like (RecB) superfamily